MSTSFHFIKAFLDTSENAVKTQIWIAACTYVLIAIIKKRLHLPHSLYEILQILSLTMFETTPMNYLRNPQLIQTRIQSLNSSFSSENRWDTTVIASKDRLPNAPFNWSSFQTTLHAPMLLVNWSIFQTTLHAPMLLVNWSIFQTTVNIPMGFLQCVTCLRGSIFQIRYEPEPCVIR